MDIKEQIESIVEKLQKDKDQTKKKMLILIKKIRKIKNNKIILVHYVLGFYFH